VTLGECDVLDNVRVTLSDEPAPHDTAQPNESEATGSDPTGSEPSESVQPHGRRLFWFVIAIAVVVVLVDQLTKLWAVTTLSLNSSVPVIGDFIRFQLIYNSGAAFSMGTNSTWVFTIIAAAAVVVICWYAWRVESKLWMLALGLLLGGAATHLGDRLFRPPAFGQGHVVDFIGYGNFFIGNVADIILFCGAVMLVVLALTGVRPQSLASSE
jgi:signal peptidase II